MTRPLALPAYQDDLSVFVSQLREYLLFSQEKLAAHFYLDRSRLSRYENNRVKDKPRPGYLAGLAQLVVEYAGNRPEEQQQLLMAVNEAIRRHYSQPRFPNWKALCDTAEAYRTEQRARYVAKNFAGSTAPDRPDDAWQAMLESRLEPPTYTGLIGVERPLNFLVNALTKIEKPWLVSIEGLGGLGKTALAQEVVRQPILRHHFHGLAWVSARQRAFAPGAGLQQTHRPALTVNALVDALLEQLDQAVPVSLTAYEKQEILRRLLKERPHLMVIDNLETAADYQTLLPLLGKLVNPSKILLTSRYSLPDNPAPTFRVSLTGLGQDEALRLVRHEAQVRGLVLLLNASDEQLKSIYELVGGNPLALKLVVGQIAALSLPEVLDNLQQRQDVEVDEFYTYIYQQAWHSLDPVSQHVLLLMPLAQDGTVAQLAAVSQLERTDLNQALRRLVQFSLVEAGGTLEARRYRIHRLTETFLLKETIRWQIIASTGVQDQRRLFYNGLLRNVQYWQQWLNDHHAEVAGLGRERDGILRAISFALHLDQAWSAVYQLILAFSPYLERGGYWEAWSQVLSQAIAAAQRSGDLAGRANLSITLALMLQRRGRIQGAIYRYRRAVRVARQSGRQFVAARACTNLGYLYIEQGHWWRAEVLCCRALAMFEAINNDYGTAHTENHLGLLYIRQERWERARTCLERACAIWQATGDGYGLMRGFINFSALSIKTGRLDEAITYLEQALHQAQQAGEETEIGTIYMNMGYAHRLRGDLNRAEAYARRAETIFRKFSNLTGLAQVQDNLGVVYRHQERWSKAMLYLEQALQGWRNLGNEVGEIETLTDLIECELARGNRRQAAARLQEVERLIGPEYRRTRYDDLRRRLVKCRRSLTEHRAW